MHGLVLLYPGPANRATLQLASRLCEHLTVAAFGPGATPLLQLAAGYDKVQRFIQAEPNTAPGIFRQLPEPQMILSPHQPARFPWHPPGWEVVLGTWQAEHHPDGTLKVRTGPPAATTTVSLPASLTVVPDAETETPLMFGRAPASVEIIAAKQTTLPPSPPQAIIREADPTAAAHALYGILAANGLAHTPPYSTSLSAITAIVAGGKGLGFHQQPAPPGATSPFAWKLHHAFDEVLHPLATALGAQVAASRAVIDIAGAEIAPLVGQSGRSVWPRLYLAAGVSGQAQHIQGMQHAWCIIAVNPDENAPIFEIAHIKVFGDALVILPELTRLLNHHRA